PTKMSDNVPYLLKCPTSYRAQAHTCTRIATPNHTRSAIESYSIPNSLVVFVSRSDDPSSISKISATRIASDAFTKSALKTAIIAYRPQNRFPVVNRLGTTYIA